MAWRIIDTQISFPNAQGRKFFTLFLGDGNLAVGDPLFDRYAVQQALGGYGKWVRIDSINVKYVGAHSGVSFMPWHYGTPIEQYAGWQITQVAGSTTLDWPNLNWLIDLKKTPKLYSFAIEVFNYEVTDMLTVAVEGEVW